MDGFLNAVLVTFSRSELHTSQSKTSKILYSYTFTEVCVIVEVVCLTLIVDSGLNLNGKHREEVKEFACFKIKAYY